MKYAQLQKLAKKHGIKANQKVGSNVEQVLKIEIYLIMFKLLV